MDAISTAHRDAWISNLERIANPVLVNLSEGGLRMAMPVECSAGAREERAPFACLEAFGRVVAGIAPWVAHEPDASNEGLKRRRFADLVRRGLAVAVDPESRDLMNFSCGSQPLVDAGFLALGLLRGYEQLWVPLDAETKRRIIGAFRSTRAIRPPSSNWLLFSAIIETFLLRAGENWDPVRVDFAVKKHLEWYKGDGVYGDGPDFHWDYYNSYVIQPFLLDVVREMTLRGLCDVSLYDRVLERAQRHAVILERLVAPDGGFPPIGRSLAYRAGAFHLLARLTLTNDLPESLPPAQVRGALSAVIARTVSVPAVFDTEGWLTIGLAGRQPSIGERYISTGSLYLCTAAFLPLGLPASDRFWTLPPADWTQRRIWRGDDAAPDHALAE